MIEIDHDHHLVWQPGNATPLLLTTIAPWAGRLRALNEEDAERAAGGDLPPERAPLVRYGILPLSTEPNSDGARPAETSTAVRPSKQPGAFKIEDSGCGESRLLSATVGRSGRGWEVRLSLNNGERLYGLGDENRDRINKRGHRTELWVRNVSCYAPSPVLVSDGGWALIVNTTYRHTWDIGATDPDTLRVVAADGALDLVAIVGLWPGELLERVTQLTGRPTLLPQWAYGLSFVCNQHTDAREMLADCMRFREHGIPCDMVGLEPGWMETYYDYTVKKRWHPERFYIPPWANLETDTFIAAARRLGFKMSLWLCCDYDLSEEAEHHTRDEKTGSENDTAGDDGYEEDPNIPHGPVRLDTITHHGQAWFEHLKQFVDQGVRAFKMDGARQVNEHPDRLYRNGMRDDEMHNLYPALLSKQMSRGFEEYTGLRSMVYSSAGYLGTHRYAATWAGDTGGGPKTVVSMLNHGLSGHSNTSCDMHVFSPEGIHFGFLQPWSQLCSWAYWRHPWLLGKRLQQIFTDYARLRYRLIPYLYSAAHEAHRTGMPMLRAMALAFPAQHCLHDLLTQYMLGEWLLVGVYTRTLHLPPGTWIDYWSGKRYEGPEVINAAIPENRGGPLFVREGAVIPMWRDTPSVTEGREDGLDLHIYPARESFTTVYQDDGMTPAYRHGEVTRTSVSCRSEAQSIRLQIDPIVGHYRGQPHEQEYRLHLHTARKLERVAAEPVDGAVVAPNPLVGQDRYFTTLVVRDRPQERTRPVLIECVAGPN